MTPAFFALAGLSLVCLFLLVMVMAFAARVEALEHAHREVKDWHDAELEHIGHEVRLLRARVNVHALVLNGPAWRNTPLNSANFPRARSVSGANMG